MCVGNNIPIDWETKKLKNLLCLLKDGTHGSHKDSEYGKFLLSAKDVVAGKVLYSDESRIISNKDFDTIHAKYKLQDKDIVLTIVGTVGRAALIRGYNNEYTFQRSVAILRTNEQILPDFLYNQIQSSTFQNELKKRQSISAQPGVYLEELANIPCVVPPLEEQEKIAQILATWDSAIEQLTDLIAEKQHQKKALMQRLLTGKQRLPGFAASWKKEKLSKLCDIETGKKDVNEGNPTGKYPFFTCAKMHTFADTFSYDKEAILIAGNGDVGNCQYYNGKFEAYQRTYILHNFRTNVKLLFQILDAKMSKYASGQKQQGAMPYIKLGTLADFLIDIPSDPAEQTAIADVLMTADAEIDLLQQQLQAITEQKQGLMQQLLTGKIRVKIDKKC